MKCKITKLIAVLSLMLAVIGTSSAEVRLIAPTTSTQPFFNAYWHQDCAWWTGPEWDVVFAYYGSMVGGVFQPGPGWVFCKYDYDFNVETEYFVLGYDSGPLPEEVSGWCFSGWTCCNCPTPNPTWVEDFETWKSQFIACGGTVIDSPSVAINGKLRKHRK